MPHVGMHIENPVAGDAVTYLELPVEGRGPLVVEMTTVAGGQGPPEHIHPLSRERFDVLEGAIALELDGRSITVAAGGSHTVPAGVPHRFLSDPELAARVRVSFDRPMRMAEFLETFYELARAGRTDPEGKPSMPQIAVTFSQLRDTIRTTVAPWRAQLAMFALLGPIGRARGLKPFYAYGELAGAGAQPLGMAAAP